MGVELDEQAKVTASGLHVVRDKTKNYQPEDDYETGIVRSMGEGDWEPVEVGDRVVVRAMSGGAAGADISSALDDTTKQTIVVLRDEVVCVIEE